jgi:selenocysteine lyase/cysteine desulfurase
MTTAATGTPATRGAPDWDALRREVPTLERYTYLDTAKKANLPRTVEEAMREWLDDVYGSAGAHSFSMEAVEETRNAVASLVGATRSALVTTLTLSAVVNCASASDSSAARIPAGRSSITTAQDLPP